MGAIERDLALVGVYHAETKEFHALGIIKRSEAKIEIVDLLPANPWLPGTLLHKTWENIIPAVREQIENQCHNFKPQTVQSALTGPQADRLLIQGLNQLVAPVFTAAKWPEGITFRGIVLA